MNAEHFVAAARSLHRFAANTRALVRHARVTIESGQALAAAVERFAACVDLAPDETTSTDETRVSDVDRARARRMLRNGGITLEPES